MSPDDAALAAQRDAAARLLALPLDPAHAPGALRFLAMAAEMAAVLERAPMDAGHVPLAPVLRLPGLPGERP